MGSGLRQGWSKILCKGTSLSLSPSLYTVIQMSPLLCVLHPLESSYKCIHFVLTISPLTEVSFPLFSSSIFLGHKVWNHNCPDLRLLSLHILTLVLRGWLNWVSAQTEWIIHSLWADFFPPVFYLRTQAIFNPLLPRCFWKTNNESHFCCTNVTTQNAQLQSQSLDFVNVLKIRHSSDRFVNNFVLYM